ncbi:MAG TPA: hypothetical protein VGC01_02740, partial [Mucilaginibacter sp.]
MVHVYAVGGNDAQWLFVFGAYTKGEPQTKYNLIRDMAGMIGRLNSSEYAQQGIAGIKDFGIKYKSQSIAPIVIGLLNDIKTQREKLNDAASATAADNAVKAINEAK